MELFSAVGPVPVALDLPRTLGEATEPAVLTHRLEEHTWLLRQSLRTTFEAPVLYLLFGEHTALLLDSGATHDRAVRTAVDAIVQRWLARHPRPRYRLVVAHTHAHGDHVAGDASFAGRPDTEVVGADLDSVRSFFALYRWPDGEALLDLGGRTLTVVPTPGHHPAHLAVADPWTGLLLTGDTVYPGRLYVEDLPAYVDALDRLVALADRAGTTHVMGAHVEMSARPGHDFPLGSRRHRDEAPLPMTVDQLHWVRDAAHAAVDRPGVHGYGDFALWNGPCRAATARQLLRTSGLRLLRRG
ncbi:MAG: MBL fold metallo-hydrolase [Nocardioidaceae bacterium]